MCGVVLLPFPPYMQATYACLTHFGLSGREERAEPGYRARARA